jgi:hypothetical protein
LRVWLARASPGFKATQQVQADQAALLKQVGPEVRAEAELADDAPRDPGDVDLYWLEITRHVFGFPSPSQYWPEVEEGRQTSRRPWVEIRH